MIQVTPTIVIPEAEITERFVRASGPGGQNVNKVNSKALLRWNVVASPSLAPCFTQAPTTVTGPHDDVLLPKGSVKADWEVELAVVIGKRCDYVGEADALGHVYSESPHGKEGAELASEKRAIYDTTKLGYGNGGHTFGDALTDTDRAALLEYLKTL